MLVTDLLAAQPTDQTVTELLREVIDPELGVNIVDLGLLRELAVSPSGAVAVALTLTTPACPLGPYLVGQIHDVLGQASAIAHVTVQVVWSRPWDPERDMSPAAKRLLGWRS